MLLFKRFLFITLILNSFTYALGQQLIIRHVEMSEYLNSLKHNVTLPNKEFNYKDTVKLDKKVPSWINKISEEIQLEVFGEKIIQLSYCKGKMSTTNRLKTHFESAVICIYEESFNKLINYPEIKRSKGAAEEVTRFVIAHEIGHFVQELNIKSRKQNFSICGVRSIYENKSNRKIIERVLGRKVETAKQIKELTYEEVLLINRIGQATKSNILRSHIEVDYYAYLILLKLSNKIEVDHIRKYFNYVYSLSNKFHTDHDLRKKILNAISDCYKYVQDYNLFEDVKECLVEKEIIYYDDVISYSRDLDRF